MECFESLQFFQKNKSPGNDGLTVEFYTDFWEDLGELLVDSLNYSLINFLMFEISPIINCGVTIKQQQLSVAENGEVGDKVLH